MIKRAVNQGKEAGGRRQSFLGHLQIQRLMGSPGEGHTISPRTFKTLS